LEFASRTCPDLSSRTLLAVDEEPLILQIIQRTLEPLGSTVLLARSGDQGLALAEERGASLDLVLTDLDMADVSGRDIALVLGQYRPLLPVGVMTGCGADEPFATTLPLLLKPFSPAALTRFVGNLIQPCYAERRDPQASALSELWARAAAAMEQSRRLSDAIQAARHARWAVLAQTGQLRAAARELRSQH
jgi:CheY-like chemotaxis protein